MNIAKDKLILALQKSYPTLSAAALDARAAALLNNLDSRLLPNLYEWIEDLPVSDLWVGKYCVNAIMSLRGDRDFFDALYAMNTYLQDEKKGEIMIWRMRA